MGAYIAYELRKNHPPSDPKKCESILCTEPATTTLVIGFLEDVFLTTKLCDSHALDMRRDLTPRYTGPTHIYLMWHPETDVYQFGKTNNLSRRINEHKRAGFVYIDSRDFGEDTSAVELDLIYWLEFKPWKIVSHRERWRGSGFTPANMQELLEAAGLHHSYS